MSESTPVLIIGLFVVIFLIGRDIFCWYFKITEISNNLKDIYHGINALNFRALSSPNSSVSGHGLMRDVSDTKESFANNDSNGVEKPSVKEEVKTALIQERQYSLNNIYDEDGLIGHEFTEHIEDGHWVLTRFNEKTKKFTVKHYRTHENINSKKGGRDQIIREELLFNKEFVFGFKDGKRYDKNGDVFIPK